MTDTQWADVSQFQAPVDDSYPWRWFAFRMCNGDGPDALGAHNYAWSQAAVARGALDGFFAYTVFYWDSNWAQNLIDEIGPNPHPNLVAMIDVESWARYNSGDCSTNLNAGAQLLTAHLGSADRVVGYGNAGDLNELWPDRSGLAPNHIIYADYSGNPGFPGAFAHQYTDAGQCAPFGVCDMNSADGYDSSSLQRLLGIPGGASLASTGTPTPFQEEDMTPEQDAILRDIQNKLSVAGATYGIPEVVEHEVEAIAAGGIKFPGADYNALQAITNAVYGIQSGAVDVTALADSLTKTLGAAVVAELAKHLSTPAS